MDIVCNPMSSLLSVYQPPREGEGALDGDRGPERRASKKSEGALVQLLIPLSAYHEVGRHRLAIRRTRCIQGPSRRQSRPLSSP